jgi:hypothetical protein
VIHVAPDQCGRSESRGFQLPLLLCFLSGESRRNFMDSQHASAGPVITTGGAPVSLCEYPLKGRNSDIQVLFPDTKACQIVFQVASSSPLPQVLAHSAPSVYTGVL